MYYRSYLHHQLSDFQLGHHLNLGGFLEYVYPKAWVFQLIISCTIANNLEDTLW